MVDRTNSKKSFITEEDIDTLLQRYEATTLLTLLREVSRFAGPKIDWDAMVKRTSTGITNAREYQMLWRHLAYRDPLRSVEDRAQPLDDDSDLEHELEAFPHVNNEASVEAAAHVKVMITSYLPSESSIPNNSTIEAPLTINIPNGPSCRGSQEQSNSPWSAKGVNITVPVSLQKQPLPAVKSTEGLNGNGLASSSMASRRKRKKWSSDEDQELIAAVEKCGEGNWANILKGDFKGDRTASQLSQRWALIRKKRDSSNVGTSQSGLRRTEAQMAANHALSLAVGQRPTAKNLMAGTSLNTPSVKTAEAPVGSSCPLPAQHRSQPSPVHTSVPTGLVAESRVNAKKTFGDLNSKPDPVIPADTAGSIAGPSGASSAPKAEQGKITGSAAIHVQSSDASTKRRVADGTEGAVSKTVQLAVGASTSSSTKLSDQMNAPSTTELVSKPNVENKEETKRSDSDDTPKEQAPEKTGLTNPETVLEKQTTVPAGNIAVEYEVGSVLDPASVKSEKPSESSMTNPPVNGSDDSKSEAKAKAKNEEDALINKTNG